MATILPPLTDTQVRQGQLFPVVADLHGISPWPGLARFFIGLSALLLLTYVCLTRTSPVPFLLFGISAGFAYASLLITTHDALHRTLTGMAWFDDWAPRFISYPALWPHVLYSELHKIHHKMNAVDLRDPERVQWTQAEYDDASAFGKWCARNQWFLSLFVLGGFGMIYAHVRDATHLWKSYPRLKSALKADVIGLIVVNAAIYAWAFHGGSALKYFVYFLLMERTVGFVQQLRSHVEHYGLWEAAENPVATQIFNCRNLSTSAFGSFFFNRLNYHSAHHAFPRIPFYRLPEATARLAAVYGNARPLPQSAHYFKTAWRLATHPQFIPAQRT